MGVKSDDDDGQQQQQHHQQQKQLNDAAKGGGGRRNKIDNHIENPAWEKQLQQEIHEQILAQTTTFSPDIDPGAGVVLRSGSSSSTSSPPLAASNHRQQQQQQYQSRSSIELETDNTAPCPGLEQQPLQGARANLSFFLFAFSKISSIFLNSKDPSFERYIIRY